MTTFATARFIIRAVNQTQKTFTEIGMGVNRLEKRFDRLGSFITRRVIPAFLALQGVNFVGRLVDEFTTIENKLKVVSKNSDDLKTAFAGITEVAKTTQSSLSGTASLYSRLAVATKDLNLSQDELLKITQAVNQTFRISGATTQETAAASIQLAQGLASGRLAGDELRSVLENNVVLGQLLAEAFNTDVGTLRDLAAEGKITGKVVSDILLKNFDQLNQKASLIAPTFARLSQVLKDQFGIGFSSAVKESFAELTTSLAGNGDAMHRFGEVVGKTIAFIINVLSELVNAIQFVGQAFEPILSFIGEKIGQLATLIEESIPAFKIGFQGLINEVIKFGNLFVAVLEGIGDAFVAFGEQISVRFEALGMDLAAFIEDPLSGISFENTKAALETGLLDAMNNAFEKSLERAKEFNKNLDSSLEESTDKLVESMQRKTEAVEGLFKKTEEATKSVEEAQEKIKNKSEEATDSIEKDFEKLGKKIEDDLVGALDAIGGKFDSFGDFAKSILSDINQILIKFALKDLGITGEGGFIEGLFSGLGSLFGGFFAEGGKLLPGKFGIVGENGPELAFSGSRPLNILPNDKLASAGGGNSVVVNMNVQTPDVNSFNQSSTQIAANLARQIERAKRNL